jgi:hypothetical protein
MRANQCCQRKTNTGEGRNNWAKTLKKTCYSPEDDYWSRWCEQEDSLGWSEDWARFATRPTTKHELKLKRSEGHGPYACSKPAVAAIEVGRFVESLAAQDDPVPCPIDQFLGAHQGTPEDFAGSTGVA